MIEHALVCPMKHITHCPDFQQLVEKVETRPPRRPAVIPRPHSPFSLEPPDHEARHRADQSTAPLDRYTP